MRETPETIDAKIAKLKQRKEKLTLQKAVSFLKESQKLLEQDFSPDLALTILHKSWTTASESTRKEWKNRERPFRPTHPANTGKKDRTPEPAHSEA